MLLTATCFIKSYDEQASYSLQEQSERGVNLMRSCEIRKQGTVIKDTGLPG